MDGPNRSDAEYWRDAEAVFADALDLPAAERANFLDRRCAQRPDLRADVLSLLASHDQAGQFITPRTGSAELDADPGADTSIGERVGSFRLIEKIGEGGMGTVYRAERVDGDFTQQVAVKLIASRLHSADTLRRFKAERQILASLQHPGIVALLDGGLAANGQPYIAMEYIDGEPITRYCTARDLPLADRIGLFLQVCRAVSFAHRHLIVHRDLKPGNIMVTPDGVVKVLDFGIAKLLQADGVPVDATRSLLGPLTADYASPEQLRGAPVSTASDVYSLGVVCYELIAGQRPYETAGKTLDQVLATVMLGDPPPASRAGSGRVPYERSTLRGDLDAIAQKAMAKDPNRRYASVEDVSADLERFLAGRPVKAQPESRWYVAGKFLGRHRLAAGAVGVATMSLVGGFGMSLWQAQIARAERDRATAEMRTAQETTRFLGGIFESANPVLARGRTVTARDLLDSGSSAIDTALAGQPAAQGQLLLIMGQAYHRLSDRPKAMDLAQRSLALHRALSPADPTAVADSLSLIGRVHRALGQQAAAIPPLDEAVRLYESTYGADDSRVAETLRDLALAKYAVETTTVATPLLERAIRIQEQRAPASASLARMLNNLGNMRQREGDDQAALAAWERSIAIYGQSREPDSWGIALPLLSMGDALRAREEFVRARQLFERALVIDRQTFGDESDSTAYSLARLGELAVAEGQLVEARRLLDVSREVYERRFPTNPGLREVRRFTGRLLLAEGRAAEARTLFEQVLKSREAESGSDHVEVAVCLVDLALADLALGRSREAESELIRAVEIRRKALNPMHPDLVRPLTLLSELRRESSFAQEAVAIARLALPEPHSHRVKAEAALRTLGPR